ncbi:Response regulator of zinc sigma-54-dependent two-component system [Dissulfuribacter thermophilus]|uniref:Response regulator of zinc sigma-54-dependent two-component system n=1 Tax=Dissulfuribacter thermophilus TaxID=1156395 RepID=A0A1B9F6Y6_9BACT|nr:sigma-54 dependent transcriptional regulator [Dissulfuribacter thermophilus]OCC15676.1 Response regulator of zinc sigma-54-dependent two-component system [Dissulfuribacter thermophilus]
MAYILVVDDESKMRHILRIMLELKGHKVKEASNGSIALKLIKEEPFDLVISDIKMPELDGFGLLDELKRLDQGPPVVFITAFATIDSAVEAMKRGAVDYITKPFEEERIHLTIEKALGISKIMEENRELKRQLDDVAGPKDIIYASPAMKKVIKMAERVAIKGDTTVLILGESGVGKEVMAHYIHKMSPRAQGKFVPVNCAAINQGLVESTLFGHERGAFTGADRRKKGLFEYAQGGTLFLDEIGDLPFEAQAKLLRALQEKAIQRVGGNDVIKIDVRVLCATNQNLEALVKKNKFRQDLFYRINVFPIEIPPLRSRTEDIIPLAKHFVKKAMGRDIDGPIFTQGAERVLLEHSWPGNVRELANAMERAVIMASSTPITVEHLSFLKPNKATGSLKDFKLPPEGINLEEFEKDIIRQALEIADNNQSKAARLLGLTRSKFRTRVKQLEND